jgi:hypothetical protein
MKLILIAREECRQGTNGFQMVSPLLHIGLLWQGGGGEGEGGTKEEQRWHREKERDAKGLVTVAVYIEET